MPLLFAHKEASHVGLEGDAPGCALAASLGTHVEAR